MGYNSRSIKRVGYQNPVLIADFEGVQQVVDYVPHDLGLSPPLTPLSFKTGTVTLNAGNGQVISTIGANDRFVIVGFSVTVNGTGSQQVRSQATPLHEWANSGLNTHVINHGNWPMIGLNDGDDLILHCLAGAGVVYRWTFWGWMRDANSQLSALP